MWLRASSGWTHTLSSSVAQVVRQSRNLLFAIRPIWLMLVLGIAIRAALMPITLNGDLVGFARTSASELYGQGPYAYSSIYPPFWSFYLNVLGRFVTVITPSPTWFSTSSQLRQLWDDSYGLSPLHVVSLTYVIAEKSSLVPFDVAAGLLLYDLAIRFTGDRKAGRLAFGLWFLNPLVIAVSAIHGAFDVIPTLFVLLALFLEFEKRYLFAGTAIAMGALFKIYPILFAPLLLAMTWKGCRAAECDRRRALGLQLVGTLTPVAVFLAPGLLSQFLSSSTLGVQTGQQGYAGFGFWGFFSLPGLAQAGMVLGASLYSFVAVLSSAVLISVLVALRHVSNQHLNSIRDTAWVQAAFLIVVSAYLIPVVNQPQYTVWVLPFVLLLGLRDRLFKGAYVAFSLLPTAFYLILLGGPLLYFLPLWYNYHLIGFEAYSSTVAYWVGPGRMYMPLALAPFSAVLTVCVFVATQEFLGRRGKPRPADPSNVPTTEG